MYSKMIIIKLHSEDLISASSLIKVLLNYIRISIIELLDDITTMMVTDIFKTLKIQQVIPSHYLKTNRYKKIMTLERVVKNNYYFDNIPKFNFCCK